MTDSKKNVETKQGNETEKSGLETKTNGKTKDVDWNTLEVKEFDEMGLRMELLRGIFGYGFEKPSKIQQKAIMPIIKTTRDVIGQAQSGTGKTATFSISMLQTLDFSTEKPVLQGLILAPTRELSQQIHKVVLALGEYLGVKCHACVGGTSVKQDIQTLKNGVHIVVGTPGRVTHMLNEGFFDPKDLKMLVIDEADEMLSRGFKDQIYGVFQHLPEDIRVCLFSATMPPDVLEITEKFMRDPIKILVKKEQLTLEGIKQFYVAVEKDEWKFDTLCDLYKTLTVAQCVIFCNTKKRVDQLADALNKKDYTVSCIVSKILSTKL